MGSAVKENRNGLFVAASTAVAADKAFAGDGEQESLLSLAADSLSHCLVLTDSLQPDNPIAYVNSAFTVMTGYEPHEAMGKNLRILQGPETDTAAMDDLRQARLAGYSIRRELLNYRKDGEVFWNDVTIDPIRNSQGHLIGFAAIMFDSSVQHNNHAERLAALDRLEVITSNAPGYVFQRVLKPDGSICYGYLSPSLFRIIGLPEDTDWSAGQNFAWLLPSDRDDFQRLTRQSAADMTPLRCDIRVLSAAGAELWFRTDSTPRRSPNGDIVWEGLAIDVTAQKLAEAEMDFVARHDVLTKLPNRFFFRNAVSEALSRPVEAARRTALFNIDLCAFATINDVWGEAIADRLLRRVALRLTELAETMAGIVTRMGGDEFGLFLADMAPQAKALEIGQRICAEISRPMIIEGHPIVVEACVGATELALGITEIPLGTEDRAAEIMKQAHLAVSAAKRKGASACVLYSSAIGDSVTNSAALKNSLRQAIESEQFELHYQPLVDLASGSVIGAEALVRWSHPDFGLIRPDVFIPIAEATRLIVPLGGWITKAVMWQTKSWKRAGVWVPRISINLSGLQLQNPGFLDMVEDALAETGCNGADFEFELTEGVLIEISPEVSARLAGLKALGFTIALDDFGSGHATFAYLRRFPLDKIKIDQIFIRQLIVGSSDATIVKAMITMARDLGLDVLAEGIETQRQRDFLIEEGCRNGQGYLFSPPLNPEDFAWMLGQRVSLPLSSPARNEHDGG
jgi:diguanylate cyclase (GGDEF)-like protein/PAS domain S-box-containing protein